MSSPRLEVDLDVFAANVRAVAERVAPAQVMLVIKDDAYGHGIEPIVARAVSSGVSWFGAFDVHDALIAREVAGGDVRIFSWLSVGSDEIAAALDADIDLGVGDADFLEEIACIARATGRTARVHLKIDTGLHRNGIRPEQWPWVLERTRSLEDSGTVRIVGVWTHIAEASDADDDEARAVFDDAVAAAEAAGFQLEVRHLAASAAAFARPEFRYDLVRIGAFCYGIRSAGGTAESSLGVRPVASLITPVTHAGDERVVLAVGALDGLPSSLARKSTVTVPGGRSDVHEIGLTRTTIASWPGAAVGDEVVVFGGTARSATDLAEDIGTVGEEILLRISPLVPRVYRGMA
jgi:alanine racemase